MMEQSLELGRYGDEHGNEIVVVGHTPDGRYDVEYPAAPNHRNVLSAKTIRRYYAPLAAAVLCLALLPAMAFAATPKQVRKAEAILARAVKANPGALDFGGGAPSTPRVACRSTGVTTISCVIEASSVNAVATFTVKHGKLHQTSGLGMAG